MARRIRVLGDRLINQIAAGEVVERPASVVKELVENSIDAGARRVEVSIANGGKTEIRVADDGHGMGREDALLSLDRHATSKIHDPDDLVSIRTLGFRGEALPSIASVSRFTLETAEREGEGTRIGVQGGRIEGVDSCARRVGTTVVVRNLFFNVPARAKFLRSAAAEARAVSEVVTTLALSHPTVGIRLESNGRELAALPAASELRARIAALWGDAFAADLIPVAHRHGRASLTGWIQRPHSATPSARRTYLFVNGRAFSDRHLVRAADRGYQTTVAPGVRPSFFLQIDVPPGEVDVNVHPSKAEVRFRDGIGTDRLVEEGVRAGLQPLVSAPSLQRAAPNAHFEMGNPPADPPSATLTRVPATEQGGRPQQMSLFVSQAIPAGLEADGEEGAEPAARPAMWQVHNTYIFAETRSGLIIVDQHSAHERVLFEQIMRDYDRGTAASQRLLFPITMQLAPAEVAIVTELSGVLAGAGFEVEGFGGRSIIVHAVPAPHPYFDAERCLRQMIGELASGSPLIDGARTQHQRVALTYACKAAIKAGQPLSPAEIAELFDRLFATELPYHDIHGRPTVVQLPLAELHNRFRRSGG